MLHIARVNCYHHMRTDATTYAVRCSADHAGHLHTRGGAADFCVARVNCYYHTRTDATTGAVKCLQGTECLETTEVQVHAIEHFPFYYGGGGKILRFGVYRAENLGCGAAARRR